MKKQTTLIIIATITLAMILTSPATAVPVTVTFDDASTCDPLINGTVDLHVLGLGAASGLPAGAGFPIDEEIVATATPISMSACPASDHPLKPNTLVVMTNVSGIDWAKVWYVADPLTTSISNVDGTVNAGQAFLIDMVGVNRPLIAETMTPDGIFEAGETWEFIIQDYARPAGLSAADFLSVGFVGIDSTGDPLSSGSIIAIAVPEPATMTLIGMGALAVIRRRRK